MMLGSARSLELEGSSFYADDTDETETAEGLMTGSAKLIDKELTAEIIGSFYTVYNAMGYGFLESPYANALSLELEARGLQVRREVPVEILYEGKAVGFYRMDMVVEGRVLLENKSTVSVGEADYRQLFNYLRASNLRVGLLLHFGPKPAHKRFIWTGRQFNSQS